MKIRIITPDAVMHARLEDNPTARNFWSMLPLTLQLDDYAGTEKVSMLARRLEMDRAPDGITPVEGDVTYYAPWGNIAIYYKDFGYSPGLIKLGEITSGMAHLKFSGAKQATIELIHTN